MRLATHAQETGHTLVAIPDNDPAGKAWAARLTDLLDEHGCDIALTEPPEIGMDLNTWANRAPGFVDEIVAVDSSAPVVRQLSGLGP